MEWLSLLLLGPPRPAWDMVWLPNVFMDAALAGANNDWSRMLDSSPTPKEATLSLVMAEVAAAELELAWWALALLGQTRILL